MAGTFIVEVQSDPFPVNIMSCSTVPVRKTVRTAVCDSVVGSSAHLTVRYDDLTFDPYRREVGELFIIVDKLVDRSPTFSYFVAFAQHLVVLHDLQKRRHLYASHGL